MPVVLKVHFPNLPHGALHRHLAKRAQGGSASREPAKRRGVLQAWAAGSAREARTGPCGHLQLVLLLGQHVAYPDEPRPRREQPHLQIAAEGQLSALTCAASPPLRAQAKRDESTGAADVRCLSFQSQPVRCGAAAPGIACLSTRASVGPCCNSRRARQVGRGGIAPAEVSTGLRAKRKQEDEESGKSIYMAFSPLAGMSRGGLSLASRKSSPPRSPGQTSARYLSRQL